MTITELHNVSLDSFIEAVEQCKGNVWLITEEGDKLNLKSRFCQILGLAKIIEGGKVTKSGAASEILPNIIGTNSAVAPCKKLSKSA